MECFVPFSSASCCFVTPFVTSLGRVPGLGTPRRVSLPRVCRFVIGDVISLEDTARPVPRDLHDYRLRHARPSKIPDRRSAEIMKQQPGDACGLARQIPAPSEVLDRR